VSLFKRAAQPAASLVSPKKAVTPPPFCLAAIADVRHNTRTTLIGILDEAVMN
jgi:hypothetical protein